MIKVLFKSEEAADSESKVVYGNTRRNSAVKYLNELTPKSNEEAIHTSEMDRYYNNVIARGILDGRK